MNSPLKTPHVFVVDDEAVIAETVAMILRTKGFECSPFTNPLEALRAASVAPPDLLITDVMMPELSGFDLAIAIRELLPNCKVLLFSGKAASASLLDAARAGGYDFELLAKPVHPEDLLERIRSLTQV